MDPPEIGNTGIGNTSLTVENDVTPNDATSAVFSGDSCAAELSPPAVLSASTTADPSAPTRPSTKPKKKKGQSQMLMTSTSTSGGGGGSVSNQGENTGRWTAEEHRLFLQGLEQHGKGWKKIASLIKSRTVVQIRTHAQKYFQKLAKARQNGEDEGAVTFMEGRGGAASTTSASTGIPRRRRQVTGTKRKAIQSVVVSAQRQGKKAAVASGVPDPMAVAIAPTLKFFVLPSASSIADSSSDSPELEDTSGHALEDSL
jgi:SHAQKYF class myb-like DNA-binding protein